MDATALRTSDGDSYDWERNAPLPLFERLSVQDNAEEAGEVKAEYYGRPVTREDVGY